MDRVGGSTGTVLSCVPDVDELVRELRQLYCTNALDLTLRIGKLVVERLYGGNRNLWRRGGKQHASYRRLEQHPDLPLSACALSRAVGIYLLSEREPSLFDATTLSSGHFQEVLSLPQRAQREILHRANREQWSVRRVREEASLWKLSGASRGRPRLPSCVRCLHELREHVRSQSLVKDLEAIEGLSADAIHELLQIAHDLGEQAQVVAGELNEQLVKLS
jgi:hypothetical protein